MPAPMYSPYYPSVFIIPNYAQQQPQIIMPGGYIKPNQQHQQPKSSSKRK